MGNRRLLRKIMVLIGGVVLVTLGLIGIVLPVMPGFLFLVGGLLLMSTEYAWAERALAWARRRFDRRRRSGPAEGPRPQLPADH